MTKRFFKHYFSYSKIKKKLRLNQKFNDVYTGGKKSLNYHDKLHKNSDKLSLFVMIVFIDV